MRSHTVTIGQMFAQQTSCTFWQFIHAWAPSQEPERQSSYVWKEANGTANVPLAKGAKRLGAATARPGIGKSPFERPKSGLGAQPL